MCGICGMIGLGGKVVHGEEILKEMAGKISHRGPDDEGFFCDQTAALANRRLSIIDVEKGHQPIFNEDGTICVVFNGEIYNQRELRKALIENGHQFSTQTDTEVLVHLYEDCGEDCVSQLNGMFTFVIWDREKKEALVARDRLGIKPLYIAQKDGFFLFGSEIKAILAHPVLEMNLDEEGLDLYLTLRYLPGEKSIFQGIEKLLPGHLVRIDARTGQCEDKCYWTPRLSAWEAPATEDQIVEELYQLLKNAVEIRLMSDVPFGAFLSGGLDSSGIVALMSQAMDEPVETFSIGFSEQAELDERQHARLVSEACETRHREVDCTAEKVEILPQLLYHFDEPFADPIIVPTFQVAELAARHVKVVLTGEGADEIFGGYTRFVSDPYIRHLQKMPGWMQNSAATLCRGIPAKGLRQQILRALEMGRMGTGERFLQWVASFSAEDKNELYVPELKGNIARRGAAYYEEWADAFPREDPTGQMLYCDMKIRLPECMLSRTDRMTMAVSLEGRTPFLDHRLVEKVMQLPSRMKIRGREEKYILKQVLSRVLPESTIRRKKKGLAVPFAQWTRYGVEKPIRRILAPEKVRKRGFFRPEYVQDLLDHWSPHAARHSQLIWSLLCFEIWCRMYLDGELSPETPLSEIA